MRIQETCARPLNSGVCSGILVPPCLKSLLGLKSGMTFFFSLFNNKTLI